MIEGLPFKTTVTSCGRICKTCYLGRVMSPIGHVMCCMFVLFSCSHSLSLLQIANWVPADAHHSSVLSERCRNTQKYKTAKKQCQSADGYALTLCPDPELFSFVQCGRVWPLPLNFVNSFLNRERACERDGVFSVC